MRRMTVLGWSSLLVISLFIFLGIFASVISPHDPRDTSLERRNANPPGYPLGCNQLGQCIFSQLVHGARLTLLIGLLSRSFALFIGITVGLAAGYFGGWVDWILMRITEIFLAFPSLLLAISISMVLGQGLTTVVLAITVVGWAETARIIRSSALELSNAEFVIASRLMGASHLRVIVTHLLPNCLPLIVVIFTMGLATAILAEASLSFLGLGVEPSVPTWGGMVSLGKDYMISRPELVLYPGFCIAFVVIIFNILGDELRDVLDPGRKSHWA